MFDRTMIILILVSHRFSACFLYTLADQLKSLNLGTLHMRPKVLFSLLGKGSCELMALETDYCLVFKLMSQGHDKNFVRIC